ncbi:conserved hypothetical protein [Coccidioides posadasii str. Silveira]|uniref:Uncharacterized protein n=3 Tax=Coccidioides posadasii TaxID=199306 RepID=E9DBB3_COCPS|nr:conserved hypothetical protein [Coccidioides posadasii str. Silveira]KMM67597.1 hypothetical protein CPAG_03931 [Coccidioides posadasii RMSCC 3488]
MKPSSLFHSLFSTRVSLHQTSKTACRHYSSPRTSSPNSQMRGRFEKLNQRLPRFLQQYTAPLVNAPVAHITSFLILHEITAVVPLFGLVGVFHYGGWMPSLGDEEGNSAFDEGVKKFGKWLRRKGWVESGVTEGNANNVSERGNSVADSAANANASQGMRLILEFATAYAITKAMLPARIIASIWATPWFARHILGPVGRGARSLLGNLKKKP